MSNIERDIFLVIKHTQKPSKGQHTEMKDWKKTGKWDTFEEATVTDSPKKLLISEASVIINVSKSKLTKNRNSELTEAQVKDMYLALLQRYQDNIAQFYVKYRPEILNAMVLEKAKQKSMQLGEEAKAAVSQTVEEREWVDAPAVGGELI